MTNPPENTRSNRLSWLRIAGLSAVALTLCVGTPMLGGCGEKPKPKKKEEAPPPPPPPEITFESMLRDLNADARVTATDGLSVQDESFARAGAALANALAKGDDAAMSGMLNRRGQSVLESLKFTGEWKRSTKDIEAVRIVYAGPSAMSGIERTQALEAMTKSILDSTARRVEELMAMGLSKDDATARATDEMLDVNKLIAAMKQESASGAERYDMVLAVAVQDPSGSYVLGWGGSRAGEGWNFGPASTTDLMRRSVKDWDGVGRVAFSMGTGRPPIADASGETPAPVNDPGKTDTPTAPNGPNLPKPLDPKPPSRNPARDVPIPGGG